MSRNTSPAYVRFLVVLMALTGCGGAKPLGTRPIAPDGGLIVDAEDGLDIHGVGSNDAGVDIEAVQVDEVTACRAPSPNYGPTSVFSLLPNGTPKAAATCPLACGDSAWPASMATNIDVALPYGPCAADTAPCSTNASIPCACGFGSGPTHGFNCTCEGGIWTCRILFLGAGLCMPCPDASTSQ
jgi:hypothetical protein